MGERDSWVTEDIRSYVVRLDTGELRELEHPLGRNPGLAPELNGLPANAKCLRNGLVTAGSLHDFIDVDGVHTEEITRTSFVLQEILMNTRAGCAHHKKRRINCIPLSQMRELMHDD